MLIFGVLECGWKWESFGVQIHNLKLGQCTWSHQMGLVVGSINGYLFMKHFQDFYLGC